MTTGIHNYLYIFAHLPKTGGQTLRHHFTKHLKRHEEFIHLGPWGYKDEQNLGMIPFEKRSNTLRQKAKVILGHDVTANTQHLVPSKKARHIIFLRDPAERIVSCYNFQMEFPVYKCQQPSFPTWYRKTPQNSICNWIILNFMASHFSPKEVQQFSNQELFKTANSILNLFWLVGLTNYLDTTAPLFLKKMGLPLKMRRKNTSGRDFPEKLKCTTSLKEQIYRENPADKQLFDLWEKKFLDTLQT